jgi:hypothetical protein
LQCDEFLRKPLPRLRVVESTPASVDPDIAAFGPPEFLESLPECGHVSLKFWVALGMRHQHADTSYSLGLLRTRSTRPPDRGAAQNRNELPSAHRIKSWPGKVG